MSESLGSQFLRTTTRIQSGSDAFDKSRLIMTFLTILGDTEILCTFRLVIEGKIGKKIPESSKLEFLEKFSANNFALSDAENNTPAVELRRFFENTISNSPQVVTAKFLECDGLATVTSLHLNFKIRRFTILLQTKKAISMDYGSSTSS